MTTYVVYATNPDDMRDAGPLSYSSGRYGWTVKAETIDEALTKAVARARQDQMYGHDWSARIVPVGAFGQARRDYARHILFRDDVNVEGYYIHNCVRRHLPDGGIEFSWF